MHRSIAIVAALVACTADTLIGATTTTFFDPSQLAWLIASGVTSDTISTQGYLFTYTRDKLFTGGYGMTEPIGRPVRVPWPNGVEAQAVTTPPPGVTDHKARITISRVDGRPFDLTAFTAKLLANTGGAGATIEIMPILNGEDAFNDPIYFNATGYYGSVFSYNTTPSYLGTTQLLKGFESYKVSLYVDFALIGLTLESAAVPGDFDGDLDVDLADLNDLTSCAAGPAVAVAGACAAKDLDYDRDVDQVDFAILQRCWSGADVPADADCAR